MSYYNIKLHLMLLPVTAGITESTRNLLDSSEISESVAEDTFILTEMVPHVSQLQVEDEQGVTTCTETSLTLRRLLVWMYDPKVRLKTLAALVDFCQGRLRRACDAGPHQNTCAST